MRKLKAFSHLDSRTTEEALSYLSKYGQESKIIAGGTDLLVMMKTGKASPKYLIDIKGISDLDFIKCDETSLEIGPSTKINTILQSDLIRKHFPVLAEAAETLGSNQIRNRATLGGNICNASPSGDMLPPLLCLDATAFILGPSGIRTVKLEQFFTGPRETILSDNEILTKIEIARPRNNPVAVYLKHCFRKALDLAIVGVAVKFELNNGRYSNIRIALGGVAPTPMRAKMTERLLENEGIDETTIEKASKIVTKEISPVSDVRGTAEYRVGMTKVLLKRGLRLTVRDVTDSEE